MFVELHRWCITVLQQDGKTLRYNRQTAWFCVRQSFQSPFEAQGGRAATLISSITASDVSRATCSLTVLPARAGMRCEGQVEEWRGESSPEISSGYAVEAEVTTIKKTSVHKYMQRNWKIRGTVDSIFETIKKFMGTSTLVRHAPFFSFQANQQNQIIKHKAFGWSGVIKIVVMNYSTCN